MATLAAFSVGRRQRLVGWVVRAAEDDYTSVVGPLDQPPLGSNPVACSDDRDADDLLPDSEPIDREARPAGELTALIVVPPDRALVTALYADDRGPRHPRQFNA